MESLRQGVWCHRCRRLELPANVTESAQGYRLVVQHVGRHQSKKIRACQLAASPLDQVALKGQGLYALGAPMMASCSLTFPANGLGSRGIVLRPSLLG